jgi:hypothetical protein
MAESDMSKSSWQKPASPHTGGLRRKVSALTSGGADAARPGALVADRGWKLRFDEPIPPPRGGRLVTLEDAGKYITRLPKAEHEAAEWQAAMEALILVATSGGPTMFARIGIMRALNCHVERVFDPRSQGSSLGTAEAEAGSLTKTEFNWIGRSRTYNHDRAALRHFSPLPVTSASASPHTPAGAVSLGEG